jgi:Cytochrome C oxidase, cbb3-type, subunit III
MRNTPLLCRVAASIGLLLIPAQHSEAGQPSPTARTGKQVYESVCIACHGPNGRGGMNLELEKIIKPPDFTDCGFANREPDRGFLAVAHRGGPSRGFSPLMPPWGTTFTEDELALAVSHIRTFCQDDRWPRGELNLPLALVTGKAFPEDEAVMRVTSQSGNVTTKVVYERRFGPLNQWEVAVPFASLESGDTGRASGLGDIALGYKRVLTHSRSRGNIASASAEIKLPTGRESDGLGGGVVVFEPFLTFGQILPANGFLQAQAGVGIPASEDHDAETFWRVAVGMSFEQGRFGRLWSPMLEVLAARPFASGATTEWDLLPGVQITINTRQHVRLGAGVRLPVTDADQRSKSALFYLLWDWFEGGFFQGW